MIPYVACLMPQEEILLFNKIKMTIEMLPHIDLGVDEEGNEIVLSCHILARAVAKAFKLKVQDGSFLVIYSLKKVKRLEDIDAMCDSTSHSWLLTATGNIIDVYPVGILGGPILISGYDRSPAKKLYVPRSSSFVSAGSFSKPSFKRSVRRVTRQIAVVKKIFDNSFLK
ncbi:MAG TPA: hypothetical protein P5096_01535 [Patescibacteria group bacterium]|nr:hypothetical protein [Patescibacteria group bacterium]